MKTRIVSALALTLVMCASATAATLLSTLGDFEPPLTSGIIEIHRGHARAVGFRTPREAAFRLDSVTLTVTPAVETNAFAPYLDLRANAPGDVPAEVALMTFPRTVMAPPVEVARYTVMAPPQTVLQPDTIYWVVVAQQQDAPLLVDTAFDWAGELSLPGPATHPPSGLATLIGYRLGRIDEPGRWVEFGAAPPGVALSGTPLPMLSAVRTVSGLSIRWPAYDTNFVLEATSVLSATTLWVSVTNDVKLADGVFLTIQDQASRYFRLRRPQ